jgi:hypothetical protein
LTAVILDSFVCDKGIKEKSQAARRNAGKRWRYVRSAWQKVVLLCGLTIAIHASYWVPRHEDHVVGRRRGVGRRGSEGRGIYPELAALGIREGVSSALQEEIARAAIYMPSFQLAKTELERRGIQLDVKTVRRITLELGQQGLAARQEDIEKWQAGQLPAGKALQGQKVVVAIDGGRVRTRAPRRGRKTAKGRHRFATPWREPKLLIIYVIDEKGRRTEDAPCVIEAGLQGPDQIAQLAAFHLHRLGAAEALEVVFLGDGAEWIWDRVPMIAQQAKLKHWLACLDFCHVMGYVNKAVLAACDDLQERRTLLKKLRRALLAGQLEKVLGILSALPKADVVEEVRTAKRYLQNRRMLLIYDQLKAKHMPIGSGAVESAVRRVINLRIKSPGMFWQEDNVEAIMFLRANALSGQWDNMLRRVEEYTRITRKRDWKGKLTPYSNKVEDNKIFELPQLVIREAA